MRTGLNQSGSSLVEVLVSLVIVSVGLLGVAGLHLKAKAQNYEAMQRAHAVSLANSIVQSMRANPAALADYLVPESKPLGPTTKQLAVNQDCSSRDACEASDMAVFDLDLLRQQLQGAHERAKDGAEAGGLLQASACITGPNDGQAGLYRVTLSWRGMNSVKANAQSESCGVSSGLYDDEASGDNLKRRRVSVASWIG